MDTVTEEELEALIWATSDKTIELSEAEICGGDATSTRFLGILISIVLGSFIWVGILLALSPH